MGVRRVNEVGDGSMRLKPVEIYKEVLREARSRLVYGYIQSNSSYHYHPFIILPSFADKHPIVNRIANHLYYLCHDSPAILTTAYLFYISS